MKIKLENETNIEKNDGLIPIPDENNSFDDFIDGIEVASDESEITEDSDSVSDPETLFDSNIDNEKIETNKESIKDDTNKKLNNQKEKSIKESKSKEKTHKTEKDIGKISRKNKIKGNTIYLVLFTLFTIVLVFFISNFVPKDNPVNAIVENTKLENRNNATQRDAEIYENILKDCLETINNSEFTNVKGSFNDKQIELLRASCLESYIKYSDYLSKFDYEIMILNFLDDCNDFSDILDFEEKAKNYISSNFTYDAIYKASNTNKNEDILMDYSVKITENIITENEITQMIKIIKANNTSIEDINVMLASFSENKAISDLTIQKIIAGLKDAYEDGILTEAAILNEINFNEENTVELRNILSENYSDESINNIIHVLIYGGEITDEQISDVIVALKISETFGEKMKKYNLSSFLTVAELRGSVSDDVKTKNELNYNEEGKTLKIGKTEW